MGWGRPTPGGWVRGEVGSADCGEGGGAFPGGVIDRKAYTPRTKHWTLFCCRT